MVTFCECSGRYYIVQIGICVADRYIMSTGGKAVLEMNKANSTTDKLIEDTERLQITDDEGLKKKSKKSNKAKAAPTVAEAQETKENDKEATKNGVAAANGTAEKEEQLVGDGESEKATATKKKKKNKKKEQGSVDSNGTADGLGAVADKELGAESGPTAESKKKSKPAGGKKSQTAKQQTEPPSLPISELFPSGQYPEGQILEHPIAANDQKAKVRSNK